MGELGGKLDGVAEGIRIFMRYWCTRFMRATDERHPLGRAGSESYSLVDNNDCL